MPPTQACLVHPLNKGPEHTTVARLPPACKRMRIDAETDGSAEQRLRDLELVDEMIGGAKAL